MRLKIAALFLISAGLQAATPPTPTSSPTPGGLYSILNRIVVEGDVRAMVTDGTSLYLGGGFSAVGPRTGSGIVWDLAGNTRLAGWPEFSGGAVRCALPDGSGGWYVGGQFTYVAGVARSGLVHLYSNGSLDPVFNVGSTFNVSCLNLDSGSLLVGGNFSNIGGLSRPNLARVDLVTGSALAGFNASAGSGVNAMAVDGLGRLYVGGNFTSIGGQPRNYLARLDAATGAADAAFTCNADSNGFVRALALDGNGGLYAAGFFTSLNGTPRQYLARVLTSTAAVDPAFICSVNSPYDFNGLMTDASGGLYVAGQFTSISSTSRPNLARVNAATGVVDLAFNATPDGALYSLSVTASGDLIVGGFFSNIGGLARLGLARLNPATGAGIASLNANLGSGVYATAQDGSGQMFIGGNFVSQGGTAVRNLAKIDLASGALDTGFSPQPANAVSSLVLHNGSLYAGGYFVTIGGLSRPYVAKLNASSGAADPAFNATATSYVYALAASGTDLYVGGNFADIGGQPWPYLAKLSASSGQADPFYYAFVAGPVNSLALEGQNLFVGGTFSSMMGINLAKFDRFNASEDPLFIGICDGGVTKVLSLGGQIVVAGYFSNVNGVPRYGLARLDASDGSVVAGFDANLNGYPSGLDSYGAFDLLVSGSMTVAGGVGVNGLAKINGSTGAGDPSLAPILPAPAAAMLVSGNQLFLGGSFNSLSNSATRGFAVMLVPSPVPTQTFTYSPTFSVTPSFSRTATPTASPSASPTDTPTDTPSATPSGTPSFTASPTLTSSPTATATGTPTETSSATPTFSSTPTQSATLSASPTTTETYTESPTPSQTTTVAPFRQSGSTASFLGPVPLPKGAELCAYFRGQPWSGEVQLFNLAGEKVAQASLSGSGLCVPTTDLAPGLYWARVKFETAAGLEERIQKVAIIK